MDYVTIICDMKNSRQLKNREAIQYQLIDMLKDANKRFAPFIVSPFIITIGDEWQGLLRYPYDYTSILSYFRKKMEPIDFYCGIGIGEVSIHNFELTVNQLDGPSFYKAREAIKIAKQFQYSLVLIQ